MSAEKVLKKLLDDFFCINDNGEIAFTYVEDTTIDYMDSDFPKELEPYLSHEQKIKLQKIKLKNHD